MVQSIKRNEDLRSIWMDFNDRFRNEMNDTITQGQKRYESLYKSWANMTRQMAGYNSHLDPKTPETIEVYNIWQNYSAKIAYRMDNAMRNRQEHYQELYNTWQDWTENLGKRMETENNDEGASIFERTFLDWLIFSGKFLAKITHGTEGTRTNLPELLMLWSKFTQSMGLAMDKLVEKGGDNYRELYTAWSSFMKNVGESLDRCVSEMESDSENLYEMWIKESEDLGRKMTRTHMDSDSEA